VDTLKIDTKFLEGFEHGGKVGTVVTSVIRMAKWLGLPVVAEGVETREQVDFLRSLGCEMIQGFFYSTPLPREEYENLLEQQNSIYPLRGKPTLLTINRINEIMGGDNLITSLLDGILGGFAIYELDRDRLEVIRVNRAYYDLMGYPDASAFSGHSRNVITQVHPEDAEKLIEACVLADRTGEVQRLSIRRYRYDGMLISLDCQVKHIGGTSEKPIICMVFRE
jgi:PAS domain-containing protein